MKFLYPGSGWTDVKKGSDTLLHHFRPGPLLDLYFWSDMSRAKNWCFTLNNYTQENEDALLSAFDSGRAVYLIYGKEVGSSGTPHLQGFISLASRARLQSLNRDFVQAHWTVARDIGASIEYCKKEGSVRELGLSPLLLPTQGKRNDLEEFKHAVKSGMVDHKELRETHSNVMARYPRFALAYVRDYKQLPDFEPHTPYDWQSNLLEIISGPPSPRFVYFVVDKDGNSGKSWFCSYVEKNICGSQVMKCGKRDDMAFELFDNPTVILVDVSRSSSEFLSYQFLEDIKDGRVFSPKYESYTKRFNSPHLIVMMNSEPDATKLSTDRYIIINIS